jgi:hypothetical protein
VCTLQADFVAAQSAVAELPLIRYLGEHPGSTAHNELREPAGWGRARGSCRADTMVSDRQPSCAGLEHDAGPARAKTRKGRRARTPMPMPTVERPSKEPPTTEGEITGRHCGPGPTAPGRDRLRAAPLDRTRRLGTDRCPLIRPVGKSSDAPVIPPIRSRAAGGHMSPHPADPSRSAGTAARSAERAPPATPRNCCREDPRKPERNKPVTNRHQPVEIRQKIFCRLG